MSEQSLALIQQWMKCVITERGDFVEKVENAAQQHGLFVEEVVAEKLGLSGRERLSIYTSGYVARLLECMRADFSVLRRFMGDSVFDAFARAYIVTEPPHSPSLFDLGAGFAKFLDETKPTGFDADADAEMTALLDLPSEIARLERARTEVMRAYGIENDPPPTEGFSAFDVLSHDLKLQATPCLRLLELKFSLVDFFEVPDQDPLPHPDLRRSFVAIGRYDYRINLKEIEHWQFAFLRACEGGSASAHIAARQAAEESGTEPSSVLAHLVLWLPIAIQSGFVRGIGGDPVHEERVSER